MNPFQCNFDTIDEPEFDNPYFDFWIFHRAQYRATASSVGNAVLIAISPSKDVQAIHINDTTTDLDNQYIISIFYV